MFIVMVLLQKMCTPLCAKDPKILELICNYIYLRKLMVIFFVNHPHCVFIVNIIFTTVQSGTFAISCECFEKRRKEIDQ